MARGAAASAAAVALLALVALATPAAAARVLEPLASLLEVPPGENAVGRLAPQQLRLTFGDREDQMLVMWSTLDTTSESCVQLSAAAQGAARSAEAASGGGQAAAVGGAAAAAHRRLAAAPGAQAPPAASTVACGSSQPFWEPALNATSQHVHSVLLSGLAPGANYAYRVGSAPEAAWSAWWAFRARRAAAQFGPGAPARLLVAGDMGDLNSRVLPGLAADAAGGGYDAFLLVGDLAYDLQDLRGRRASRFLSALQPVAARVPLLVLPGNHEAGAWNFSHYRRLFAMPGARGSESLYWSLDLGPLHLTAYNTEVFFWPQWFGEAHMRRMRDWMAADLAAAAANRGATPWIVVAGHRPMYCAARSARGGGCDAEHEASRRGLPTVCPHDNPRACRRVRGRGLDVEQLLFSFGVDLAVFGHVHCYERYAPTFNHTVRHGPRSSFHRYLNPRATAHVTTGAGGNKEMRVGPEPPPRGPCAHSAPWCVFQSGHAPGARQSADYSHSRLTVHNASHLCWQQVSATLGGVIDNWWLVQERHGPFSAAA